MSAYWTKEELENTVKRCKKKLKVIKEFQEIDKSFDLLDKENLTKVLDYKGLMRLTITAKEQDLREGNYYLEDDDIKTVKEGK
tara:strand:+ start:227 stop:475 length:249 start_codon:yes stop_codon:yes gene_type:complete